MADSNTAIMRGLIQTVKSYPLLDDVAHPEYKSTGERERLWGRIGRDLGISALVAKTKWRNLRDCYMKYLRSSQASKDGNSVSTLPYKSWQWAEEMSFVRPQRFLKRGAAAARRGRGAGAPHDDDDLEKEDAGEPKGQRGAGTKAVADDDLWQEMRRRRRQHTQHSTAAPLPPTPRPARDPHPHPHRPANDPRLAPLDATEHIFLGYAKLVKSFSPRRRAVLKLKIANLMMEAELEELNEQSEGDAVVEMDMGDDPLEKGDVAKLEPEDSDEEDQVEEQE